MAAKRIPERWYRASLKEVADELGISPESVRAAELRGLRKARAELDRRGMTFADLVPSERHDVDSDWPDMRGA